MSRLSLFNSPLLLGFDHFERALDRVSKVSADGYPPYNVEQLGENALRITLAVAGFQMSDLSITVEDNQLVVRGRQTDDTQRVYLHRGIAARQFQRSFVLAEGIEISGALLLVTHTPDGNCRIPLVAGSAATAAAIASRSSVVPSHRAPWSVTFTRPTVCGPRAGADWLSATAGIVSTRTEKAQRSTVWFMFLTSSQVPAFSQAAVGR